MLAKRFLFPTVMAFLGVAFAGCATVPRKQVPARLGLKELCERHDIQWQWDPVSQVVTLKHGQLQAKGLVGSPVVMFREEKIELTAPLVREREEIVVPPDFQEKVVDRLLIALIPSVKRIQTIVIDAGHGGKDPGAIGISGVYEKKIVLDIAQKLKVLLEQNGFAVTMTRDRDDFISLEKRSEIAAKSRADLFLSIHANSNPSRNVQGIEVYTLRDLNYHEKEEDQRLKNHRLFYDHLAMEKNDPQAGRIVSDMLYRYKQAASPVIAAALAKDASKTAKIQNRGSKKSGFFVLRNTLVPAVLVEVGYLSNAKEEKLLKTDSYRQAIAYGLADAVIEYASYY